jgi:hypothetical protein
MQISKFIYIVIALSATGCATTSVQEYQAPDGTTVKTVKCVSENSKCFAQATQSCSGNGTYRVISSESHAGGMLADLVPGPVTWYSITYACGPSDGKMPEFKFTGERYVPPPPSPAPLVIKQKPTTTHCNNIGGSVTCNTY